MPRQTKNLKIMCRFNISIDDSVMEAIRPSITAGMDENAWVQHQVNLLFRQIADSNQEKAFDEEYMSRLIRLSAPTWADVNDADAYIHELRGE